MSFLCDDVCNYCDDYIPEGEGRYGHSKMKEIMCFECSKDLYKDLLEVVAVSKRNKIQFLHSDLSPCDMSVYHQLH